MKKFCIIMLTFLLLAPVSYSQNIRTLRNKLGDVMIDKAIDDTFGDKDNSSSDQSTKPSDSRSDRPGQKSGGSGIDTSLDDVPDALTAASSEFDKKAYKDARISLRKALRTLEFRLGEQLLASLPESVKGLSVQSEKDEVAPSGSSWSGLSIHREYQKNDTWAAITIFNSSFAGIAGTAVQSGYYGAYTDESENRKNIRVKGNDAVITFSDSSGYSISVSPGQSTFVLIEGVNVASEAEMVAIAESFDYNNMKKLLGDQ